MNDFIPFLYSQKNLIQSCPEHLKNDFLEINRIVKRHLKANKAAKIKQFYQLEDIIPKFVLARYTNYKKQIEKHILETYEKPKNYEHLYKIYEMVKTISSQTLNLTTSEKHSNRIYYNIFGTKTGRLSTNPRSFPILTISKDRRKELIQPNNSRLIEMDWKSAEFRTFLYLIDHKNAEIEDLHSYHMDVLGTESAGHTKKLSWEWLYGNKTIEQFEKKLGYSKDKLNRYFSGNLIETPFQRIIYSEKRKLIPHLIQSTTFDLFMESSYNLYKMLQNKKSYILGFIHDSAIIDFSKEDLDIEDEMEDILSSTRWGKFYVRKI